MKIVVGLTGASGSIYCKLLVETLLEQEHSVHLIASDMGKQVFGHELNIPYEAFITTLQHQYPTFVEEKNDNLFAGVASGSYPYDAVIICPCSMGTLASIANGISSHLLTRVCDVAIKEKRKLVIMPRETPFSAIHLENMLKLSRLGVTILPAMPGFYHDPKTLEDLVAFVVGKALDSLNISHKLYKKWKETES